MHREPQGYQEEAKPPRGYLPEQDWSRAGLSESRTGRWFRAQSYWEAEQQESGSHPSVSPLMWQLCPPYFFLFLLAPTLSALCLCFLPVASDCTWLWLLCVHSHLALAPSANCLWTSSLTGATARTNWLRQTLHGPDFPRGTFFQLSGSPLLDCPQVGCPLVAHILVVDHMGESHRWECREELSWCRAGCPGLPSPASESRTMFSKRGPGPLQNPVPSLHAWKLWEPGNLTKTRSRGIWQRFCLNAHFNKG